MTKQKFTPGEWTLELVQRFPFGVRIMAGDKEILNQHAYCFSTKQKTRQDNELGIGFDSDFECAAEAIAEQDANARLLASAPRLLTAIENYLYGRKDARECEAEMREAVAMARGED